MEKKRLKFFIASIITLVMVIALFGFVFSTLTTRPRDEHFWLELAFCTALGVAVKILWYESAEEETMYLLREDLRTYDNYVEEEVKDVNDLAAFLEILNRKNREAFVASEIGYLTPENCKHYARKLARAQRRACRLREVTAMQIMTKTIKKNILDAQNYRASRKYFYLIVGTLLTTGFMIILASIMPKEFLASWESLFRYLSYIGSISLALVLSNVIGAKNTRTETLDYLARLTFIVDSYVHYKRSKQNGV